MKEMEVAFPISFTGKDDDRSMPQLLNEFLLLYRAEVKSDDEWLMVSLFVNMALRWRIKEAVIAEGLTKEQAGRVINRLVGAPPEGYGNRPRQRN
jgi:hypothetical protein